MGFFSYKCPKCHLSIRNPYGDDAHLNHVTAVFKTGKVVSGFYDGYGRADGVELIEDFDNEQSWFHTPCYNGETFTPSEYAEDQGHWSLDENAQGVLHVTVGKTTLSFKTDDLDETVDWVGLYPTDDQHDDLAALLAPVDEHPDSTIEALFERFNEIGGRDLFTKGMTLTIGALNARWETL